tara:strand:+ start:1855 stop:2544 length:690 start_codon:yes stop_codon:yes gene_type:complete
MKKHPIFPVELFTFESSPELVEETLDALDPIERGNFNLPNTVQTTQGNLHCLPQFKNTFEWIDQCLDEVKKDQQFEMWGKFEVSLAWGVVSLPNSGGCHQPHRHPMSYYSGTYCLTDGYPTLFQDPVQARAYNQLEIISAVYENAVEAPVYKPGTLVIFPSWLVHFTAPHFADFVRANISFNAFPTGPINQGPYGQNMINCKLVQDDELRRRGHGEEDIGYGHGPQMAL